jgi:lipoprotein-releasing system ATP-binding protein
MSAATEVMVKIEDLRKHFPRQGEDVHVLNGIDLEIKTGETVAVVGMSGAGKSTLLHILGALEPPSGGRVIINGTQLSSLDSKRLADFRNRHLGFVFQFHHLLPEFTALENTMMPALIARTPEPEARALATAILGELFLSHRLDHKAGELSGGEQQRVAIARAIILKPSLLLADEPTGNLDAKTGKTVEDILLRLNRERRITMLIVTHNEALAHRMDRVIRLNDGQVEK